MNRLTHECSVTTCKVESEGADIIRHIPGFYLQPPQIYLPCCWSVLQLKGFKLWVWPLGFYCPSWPISSIFLLSHPVQVVAAHSGSWQPAHLRSWMIIWPQLVNAPRVVLPQTYGDIKADGESLTLVSLLLDHSSLGQTQPQWENKATPPSTIVILSPKAPVMCGFQGYGREGTRTQHMGMVEMMILGWMRWDSEAIWALLPFAGEAWW